jgi:hypothetical protein
MRVLFALVLVACDHAQAPAVSIVPLPTTAQTVETVVEVRAPKTSIDDGDFSSERGVVHLAAEPDGRLAGTYPNGVLTCSAAFACRWYERSSEGRATFHRKTDGKLEGTWGNDASDDDGGSWTLVPIARNGGVDGVWDTNWGVAKIETKRGGLHVEYETGSMDCTEHDKKLDCTWSESSMTGAAELVVESPRVMRGRRGSGASSSDGGYWVFVKR